MLIIPRNDRSASPTGTGSVWIALDKINSKLLKSVSALNQSLSINIDLYRGQYIPYRCVKFDFDETKSVDNRMKLNKSSLVYIDLV